MASGLGASGFRVLRSILGKLGFKKDERRCAGGSEGGGLPTAGPRRSDIQWRPDRNTTEPHILF